MRGYFILVFVQLCKFDRDASTGVLGKASFVTIYFEPHKNMSIVMTRGVTMPLLGRL